MEENKCVPDINLPFDILLSIAQTDAQTYCLMCTALPEIGRWSIALPFRRRARAMYKYFRVQRTAIFGESKAQVNFIQNKVRSFEDIPSCVILFPNHPRSYLWLKKSLSFDDLRTDFGDKIFDNLHREGGLPAADICWRSFSGVYRDEDNISRERRWAINGLTDRADGPAHELYIRGRLVSETWYRAGVVYRGDDLPSQTDISYGPMVDADDECLISYSWFSGDEYYRQNGPAYQAYTSDGKWQRSVWYDKGIPRRRDVPSRTVEGEIETTYINIILDM